MTCMTWSLCLATLCHSTPACLLFQTSASHSLPGLLTTWRCLILPNWILITCFVGGNPQRSRKLLFYNFLRYSKTVHSPWSFWGWPSQTCPAGWTNPLSPSSSTPPRCLTSWESWDGLVGAPLWHLLVYCNHAWLGWTYWVYCDALGFFISWLYTCTVHLMTKFSNVLLRKAVREKILRSFSLSKLFRF